MKVNKCQKKLKHLLLAVATALIGTLKKSQRGPKKRLKQYNAFKLEVLYDIHNKFCEHMPE